MAVPGRGIVAAVATNPWHGHILPSGISVEDTWKHGGNMGSLFMTMPWTERPSYCCLQMALVPYRKNMHLYGAPPRSRMTTGA